MSISARKTALRIGAGSAWWADSIAPAQAIAEHGRLDYLCFETMAEVTISAAQVRRRRDRAFGGYDTLLEERFDAVLPGCLAAGTKIVSNQGWINPLGAAEAAVAALRRVSARGVRVAAVDGALITDQILSLADTVMETGAALADIADTIVSAEVYLGVAGILEALAGGAQIVITGRVADPSLFAAPMIHEFGWALDDWDRLGQGHGIGHLLECGAHITGGYFADPGYKDVPDLWNLGLPIAEVADDGSAVITKLDGTGGLIDLRTVKEQILYEVFDPARYLTPDVVVDFSTVRLEQLGADRVSVAGISGHPRTATLKASVGCLEGYAGEDIMFFAGEGAVDRARLAEMVVRQRFAALDLHADDMRFDLLGINALHGAATPADASQPYEVGLRVAVRARTAAEAGKVARVFDTMGVGGVGMVGKRLPGADRVREVVGVWSTLVDRDAVRPQVQFLES